MREIFKTTLIVGFFLGTVACTAASENPVESEADSAALAAPPAMPSSSNAPAASRNVAPAPQAAMPRASVPEPSPAPPRVFEVPAGTALTFTLIDSLSTEVSQPGDTFEASLTNALVVDGETIVAKNALAQGRVVAVDEPGRVSGLARIELTMTAVQANGQTVELHTRPYVAVAEATKTEDATKIGAGAGIGAAIGAALGGGKGAAVGAAIGGGSGTAVVMATRGDQIRLPSETRIEFELDRAVSIMEGAGGVS